MLIKSFVLLILILIPLFIFNSKQSHIVKPKIIFLTPTPSVNISQSPSILTVTENPPPEIILTSPSPSISNPQPSVPTPIISTPKNNINSFIYPGSTIISQNDNSIILYSTDIPGAITDWYKKKLNQSGLNITTIITTSSNDSVSNKLTASNNNNEIEVEIHKPSGSAMINIVVSKN